MSIESLYDRHAGRLFAVALRILGDEAAAGSVLEEVFVLAASGSAGAELPALIRLTRDRALRRQAQNPPAPVDTSGQISERANPRQLVEAAFFGGMDVAALARAHALSETEVRTALRTGMAELRNQLVAAGKR